MKNREGCGSRLTCSTIHQLGSARRSVNKQAGRRTRNDIFIKITELLQSTGISVHYRGHIWVYLSQNLILSQFNPLHNLSSHLKHLVALSFSFCNLNFVCAKCPASLAHLSLIKPTTATCADLKKKCKFFPYPLHYFLLDTSIFKRPVLSWVHK
jgi:hypothetical protein